MDGQYGADVNAIPPRTGIASLVWMVPVFVAVVSIGALAFLSFAGGLVES